MIDTRCVVCRRIISYRFAICAACESEYGSVARNWPLWLRYLWASEQSERRKQRQRLVREISIDLLEVDEVIHE